MSQSDLTWLRDRFGYGLDGDSYLIDLGLPGRQAHGRVVAAVWLAAHLAGRGGSCPSVQAKADATVAGFSEATIKHAARLAGVTMTRLPGSAYTLWTLPGYSAE